MIVAQTNRLDPETPTEITRIVRFPENYPVAAYDLTFGIRWTVIDARIGKIAAMAFFRSPADWYEDDSESVVETGTVFSSKTRDNLALDLMGSLERPDHNPRPYLVGILDDIARGLLESASA